MFLKKFHKIYWKTPVPECSSACNIIKNEALAQVLSYGFCEISKNTFFTENLWCLLLDGQNIAVKKLWQMDYLPLACTEALSNGILLLNEWYQIFRYIFSPLFYFFHFSRLFLSPIFPSNISHSLAHLFPMRPFCTTLEWYIVFDPDSCHMIFQITRLEIFYTW